MQTTGAADLIKFPPQLGHTVANHSPVRFNLGFARSTKTAETAALSLQVSPTPHQPTCLIVEMRQFTLQPAFRGRGALTDNLQDQHSAVDYLRPGCLFPLPSLGSISCREQL